MMANSSAMPPVAMKLTHNQNMLVVLCAIIGCFDVPRYMRIFCVKKSGVSNIFLSANIASKGMVNSAITSIEATVRNLAYIGT